MEPSIAPPLYSNASIHIGFLPEAGEINLRIMEGYRQLREEDLLRRSHFFGGRYENLYIDRERIPAIGQMLGQAEDYARRILQRPDEGLRCGFWLNDMGPGQATTEHDHDDYDELLSGVYYVHVPQNSGDLVIPERRIHTRTLVTPQAGMFVFFSPAVVHSVSVNLSGERRLSIGMNFGPVRPDF